MDTQERLLALADEAAAQVGVTVLRARLGGGARGTASLVVTVDREGGVDLDAITAMSRTLSALLDRDDPIPGSYVLEVESPGERRPLRLPQDADRFVGHAVDVAVREAGRIRRFSGRLVGADAAGAEIWPDGAPQAVVVRLGDLEEVRLARPKPVQDPRKPGARRHGSKGRHA